MLRDLRTLFWLQGKLTLSMLRTRRVSDQLEVVKLIAGFVTVLILFPLFLLSGVGLGVGLAMLTPGAAYELALIVNVFVFFMWLLMPASQNSQMLERFEMSRLFSYPIPFRTIVVGSALISAVTMSGLWTVPLLLGEVIGLAWHQPLALPAIVLGAVPVFALLVLTGRVMEDLFDLVAGDRRLRALALALLSAPFIVCWMGQYVVQQVTDNYQDLPVFAQTPIAEELSQLPDPETFSEFVDVLGQMLEIVEASRYLVWLPPGWATAGMALVVRGEWGRWLLFLAGSVAFAAALLWLHARVTRRLMSGAALSMGAERVRSREWGIGLPGPSALWALLNKDWRHLWRSPIPRRLVFSTLMLVLAIGVPLRELPGSNLPPEIRRAVPILAFALAATMVGMGTNMVMTANYYGTVDREGFVVLMLSPVDRRLVLVSSNLVVLAFALAQDLLLAAVIAFLSRSWIVLPLSMYLAVCLQIGSMPGCSVAAMLAPYRTQLKHSTRRQSGNIWGMLSWLLGSVPVLACTVLPYVFWRPGLIVTLPLAAAYSLVLYVFTLKPLSRLLMRRESAILAAVTAQD